MTTNTATLTCLDAKTGEVKFEKAPLEGLGIIYASPVGAGGHVYITDRDGKTAVVKQSDTFAPVAVNTLEDGFDATPVVVENELILRGTKYLYCIAAS
jgi:outer membrane protein assembly factor BamB